MSNTYDMKAINRKIAEDPKGLVEGFEREYDSMVENLASCVLTELSHHRIIMLSGPSGSGKTTTSLKLERCMEERGVIAHTLSLDNFFKDKGRTLLPNGKPDYESVYALDLDALHDCMESLVEGRETYIPKFSFKTGKSDPRHSTLRLHENEVVVVEGIHALNDLITQRLPSHRVLKLYISFSSDYLSDGSVWLPKRDARLLRRLVRDHKFRASSAANTLEMWQDVIPAEVTYVLPFKKRADLTFNSAFPYDPAAMKADALPLLREAAEEERWHGYAGWLIERLQAFETLDAALIPPSSLLREFLGDSIYYSHE